MRRGFFIIRAYKEGEMGKSGGTFKDTTEKPLRCPACGDYDIAAYDDYIFIRSLHQNEKGEWAEKELWNKEDAPYGKYMPTMYFACECGYRWRHPGVLEDLVHHSLREADPITDWKVYR